MPKDFKYDVMQLIGLVEERPCLWDKTLENYKDRLERRTAWEEIFRILNDKYDELAPEDKKVTGEHIMVKWTNVRDTFVKSLKPKMGKPKRKYIFHNNLKFLKKVVKEEEYSIEIDGNSYFKDERESEEEVLYNVKRRKSVRDNDRGEPSSSMEYVSQNNDIDFVQVDHEQMINDPRVMNEDEAFFASLLPTVVKYNEDDRLEFRIQVLALMRKIKEQRKWSN